MLKIDRKFRYLLAGGWNTAFGYGAMGCLYQIFSHSLSVIYIAILANILSITMSFISYKIFVFQKKGNWLNEYLRCYLVYGGVAVLNILFNWIFIDRLNFSVWISQGICIPLAVIFSYYFHANFTFKKDKRVSP